MQHLDDVAALLGGPRGLGRKLATERDLVELVRRGLPYHSLERAARELHLSEDETLRSLGLPTRTLARRKAEGARLKPSESERVVRLARVATLAFDVLGDRERARRWLTKPNRALGGDIPLDLLDTDVGTEEVIATLHRLEHGISG